MRYVVAAAVVVAMAIFGTVGTILVTSGRPIVMECQGLVTATCEEALEYWKDRFAEAGHSEPVMAFRFKSAYGGTCGDVDITFWPIDWELARPLC